MVQKFWTWALICWSAFSSAQELDEVNSETRTRFSRPEFTIQKQNSSEVFFEYESYTSASRPSFSEDLYDSNVLIHLHPKYQGHLIGAINYKVDSLFTYSSQEEWVYPKMSDAYLSVNEDLLRVGFVKENWLDFEEEWRLGLYRPRFMNNKLTGGQGGIPGLHFKGGGFLLSLLPIHIPELGPQFEEVNGELVSRNPWFGEKPNTLTYGGVEAPIRYNVNMPPLSDLVLKPGVALSYEKSFGNYLPRVSAAYKPIPQILLNFPADGRFIIGNNEDYFSVEVQPMVAYHTLVSTDQELHFNDGNSRVRVSLAHEIPDIPDRPESWVTQEMNDATFLSSRIESSLGDSRNVNVFLSQLKVWGGDLPDKGRFATEETYFETRQFFRDAYGIGVTAQLFYKIPFQSEISFQYDLAQNGAVFLTRHDLWLGKNLKVSGVFEMLGLLSDQNPLPGGFFSQYRANDRAEVGVSYAF